MRARAVIWPNLLTDVVMPKMHGKDLADVIVASRPGIRVLFMSGYAEPMLGKSGILDPSILLLEKPFTTASLGQGARSIQHQRPDTAGACAAAIRAKLTPDVA